MFQKRQKHDVRFSEDMRSFIPPFIGTDLLSVSIQRARELNIPLYNQARISLGLSPAVKWSDISSNIKVQNTLKQIYGNISNVESYVGAIAEDSGDSAVGPLMRASIDEQYTRIRNGDPNFYLIPGILSQNDANDLLSVSLGQIIKWNTNIKNARVNPFHFDISAIRGSSSSSSSANTITFTSDFKVQYNIFGSLINFVVTSNYTWFAFGFGSNMNSIDAFMFQNVGNKWTISNMYASYHGILNNISISNTLNFKDVSSSGGPTTLQFSRSLIPTGDKRFISVLNSLQDISFAGGMTSIPSYHGQNRGTVSINFYSSMSVVSTTSSTNRSLYALHGFLMALLFGIFFPIGMFVARFYPVLADWVNYHKLVMSILSISCVLIAFFGIIGNTNKVYTSHAIYGYTLTVIVMTIALAGFKSSAGPNNAVDSLFLAIRQYHRLMGYTLFFLGSSQCILGTTELSILYDGNLYFLPYIFPILPIISLSSLYILFRYLKLDETRMHNSNYTKLLVDYKWEQINERVAQGSNWIVVHSIICLFLLT